MSPVDSLHVLEWSVHVIAGREYSHHPPGFALNDQEKHQEAVKAKIISSSCQHYQEEMMDLVPASEGLKALRTNQMNSSSADARNAESRKNKTKE